MRKSYFPLLLVLILLLMSNFLQAEEKKSRIGIGIGMTNLWRLYDSVFIIPIHFSPGFKIEPEFSFYMRSDSAFILNEPSTSLTLGCGFFAKTNKEKASIYYGARTGIIYYSYEDNIDLYVGPAIGGEHYLSEHFSLGVEVQLIYTFYNLFNGAFTRSELRTRTFLFARLYF